MFLPLDCCPQLEAKGVIHFCLLNEVRIFGFSVPLAEGLSHPLRELDPSGWNADRGVSTQGFQSWFPLSLGGLGHLWPIGTYCYERVPVQTKTLLV